MGPKEADSFATPMCSLKFDSTLGCLTAVYDVRKHVYSPHFRYDINVTIIGVPEIYNMVKPLCYRSVIDLKIRRELDHIAAKTTSILLV